MAAKPVEPDDPMELVGVEVPGEPGTMREMAYVFAEELARLGFGERRQLALFRNPFYAGPYRAYRALGEPAIRAIVAECVEVLGRPATTRWGGLEAGTRPAGGRSAPPQGEIGA